MPDLPPRLIVVMILAVVAIGAVILLARTMAAMKRDVERSGWKDESKPRFDDARGRWARQMRAYRSLYPKGAKYWLLWVWQLSAIACVVAIIAIMARA